MEASTKPRKQLAPITLRVAIGVLFVTAGLSKLLAPAATASVVASRNLPAPELIGATVGLAEILCGILLIAAWQVRPVAVALAAFVVVAAGIFHLPIVLAGPRALELAVDAGVLAALYTLATRRRPRSSGADASAPRAESGR